MTIYSADQMLFSPPTQKFSLATSSNHAPAMNPASVSPKPLPESMNGPSSQWAQSLLTSGQRLPLNKRGRSGLNLIVGNSRLGSLMWMWVRWIKSTLKSNILRPPYYELNLRSPRSLTLTNPRKSPFLRRNIVTAHKRNLRFLKRWLKFLKPKSTWRGTEGSTSM